MCSPGLPQILSVAEDKLKSPFPPASPVLGFQVHTTVLGRNWIFELMVFVE